MAIRRVLGLACVLAALAGATGGLAASGALAGTSPARTASSGGSSIVVIVMENKDDTDVVGSSAAPYENELARRYGLATESFAITHPSLPNYIALTSGSTHGISSDCDSCSVNAPNLGEQLSGAGISWRGYFQDVPGPCYTGTSAGDYAKRHNPFIYYDDIASNRSLCSHLVGFGPLDAALRSGHLPTFTWITPNLCNDTHDCGVGTGDAFLARTVPKLLHALGPHGFLVITWDEGLSSDVNGCCGVARGGHIATIVAGPDVIGGGRDKAPIDHYGVLATIERALGLPLLAGAQNSANGSLAPLFKHFPSLG
jgi:phosphatidylinositol-3-phosphatase